MKKIAIVDDARIAEAGKATIIAALDATKEGWSDHATLMAQIQLFTAQADEYVSVGRFEEAIQSYGNSALRLILIIASVSALRDGVEEAVN